MGGSMRRDIMDQWRTLDLHAQPSKGENGVHGSASPIEALFERANWLQQDMAADVYGESLVAAGIPVATLQEWSGDPAVEFEGTKQSLFDLHEDLDAPECTARALQVFAAA